MKQEFLQQFPFVYLTVAALVIFLALFIALVLKVTVYKNPSLQQALSELPLEDDKKGANHVG